MSSNAAVVNVSYLMILSTVFGLNELFEAIMKGNEAAVFNLLEQNSKLNLLEQNSIKTFLGIPVYSVNSRDRALQQTPLEFAIKFRRENIAKILIKRGARVHGRPLENAIRAGMEQLVKFILDNAIFSPLGHSFTFLHEAVSSGKATIVKMICDKGVNLDKINCNYTPLQWAIHRNVEVEIVRILLKAGANVNGTNANLYTVLHFAGRYPEYKEKREIMDLLLSVKGVDIEAININGETPLLTAASNENVECMRALLAVGANVHARDNSEKTILHHISSSGDEDIINLAKSYGFDFECKDEKGDTPFLYSARYEDVNAMRALTKAGANINVYNKEKKGVMQYAVQAYRHSAEIVEIALFYGANWDFLNETKQQLNLRFLDRRGGMGRLVRNKLLEAGLQLSRKENMEFLQKYWPPCHEIVENGIFQNFHELFQKATDALLKNNVPKIIRSDDEDLLSLLREYEWKGAFALFQILKTIYDKKEPASELERRKFEIFDYAVAKIMEGTYLTTFPVELTSDILLYSTFYRWKLETISFHLALAFEELNVSLDRVKKAMVEIICNY